MSNTRSSRGIKQRIAIHVRMRPYERRSVCVIPASVANYSDRPTGACTGRNHTHFTRETVKAAVERGEMRFVDRHHNVATYTTEASETWQKTKSGPVHTMQMIEGLKGRAVPASQREREEVQA